MRFLVQPTPEALARARPPVRAFLVFAALALAGLAVQRIANGGLTASGVEGFYLAGGDPLPAAALWEEVHTGAFLYGFVLLVLGSLLAVSPVPAWVRGPGFTAVVAATLADLFAPFAVVRLHGAGGLRVATSVAALVGVAALVAVAWVAYGRPRAARGRHHRHAHRRPA
ncbi:hypothetical protein [Anaeromyxobacter oryzae]|uniref:Uncharacterized protein n=1 Tax=Anaeromyxobacter oryzae TaxID=2918170 RepID=A0ABM7X3P2_9BACT|nr:hypothetical protein [Anaeromyxobacter oryzae]BDG06421.1 hypothetical protein AMOR_54170 [Anaeromyxobacter oryzae]